MSYTNGLDKPTDYFETILWSAVDTSIDTLDFQPDWVWIKSRSNADTQVLFDAVRGTGKRLSSSATTEEQTKTDELTAFNSDGFTIGTGDNVNRSGHNYVSWNWKAGGSASSNSNGSITSSVSASTDAGFSIVSYTGTGSNATVGHGLSSAPKMIIVKNRSAGDSWIVGHGSIGFTKFIKLDENGAAADSSGFFNNTAPTSSVFSVGNQDDVNASSENIIAYCFAEKKGYSKFGSYVGNNNDDGTFVYTGFKPAFVLIKITAGQSDNWIMQDNKINSFNGASSQRLRPNSNNAEFSSSNEIDLLSNGFKCHGADGEINGSGFSYIYMAFAESPFVTSTGIPTTAR